MFNPILLPNTHKRICILTDFEPDDILALHLLFENVQHDIETLFIVGESKLSKVQMCYEFCETLRLTNYTILQGSMSSKDYPPDMLTLFQSDQVQKRERYIDHHFTKVSQQTLNNFEFESALIVALKPFSELIKYVDVKKFAKSTLALYGSFNLRCMLQHNTTEQVEMFLNNAFERVILYESYFATGEQNSASEQNFPLMFKLLSQDYRFKSLFKAIKLWNTHIAEDCFETIVDLLPKIREQLYDHAWEQLEKTMTRVIQSNAKVLLDISRAKSQQIVIADFALIAVLLCTEKSDTIAKYSPVKFLFGENNYTRAIPDTNSRIMLVEKVDVDILQDEIVQKLFLHKT